MKKIVVILLVLSFMAYTVLCVAKAEINLERWIFDPRISVDVVDRVNDDGTYSVYYAIAEDFVITLDRDIRNDTGHLTMYRGDLNNCRIYCDSDWGNKEESDRIINEWINMALMMV